MTPVWFFSWALWVTNLVFDDKGGSIHFFFSYWTIIYMVMPILIQPVFLILTFFGYGDTTVPRSNDSSFWVYWLLFLASDWVNLLVFYYTVYGLQFQYLNAVSDAKKANEKKCYDETTGEQVECIQQILD
jgi:hypothetical protein